MTADAVTEVHTRPQHGRRAVGPVFQSGEEATDAADGDAGRQRDGKQIAGPRRHTEPPLGGFDSDEPADQAADNGLTREQEVQIVPVRHEQRRVFNPIQRPAPDCAADGRRRHDRPSRHARDRIAAAAAKPAIDLEAGRVREQFEDEVRMPPPRAEIDEDREGHFTGRSYLLAWDHELCHAVGVVPVNSGHFPQVFRLSDG